MPHATRIALGLSALLGAAAWAAPASAQGIRAPEPDPPAIEGGPSVPAPALRVPRAPSQEWVLHRSADGQHPNGEEQELLWLMNRARQDPAAEGLWLATSGESDIALGRAYFGVDVDALQDAFDGLEPAPPAAFDRRLYEASRAHSEHMIDVDDQNHDQQIERIIAAGFEFAGARVSAFAFADSPLNAHAALNIDWGIGPDGMQDPPGHRLAIMGSYPNVGLALVPDDDAGTEVGPLVFSGAYMEADTNAPEHFNRFLVGTVWDDLDLDGRYDAGEGVEGVTVMPNNGLYYAVTSAGGGYAIPILSSGLYQVQFSGGPLTQPRLHSVSFGAESKLLDVLAPEPSRLLLLVAGAVALALAGRRGRS